MKTDSERDRAQRIRDAQISARNPGESKIKGYDWSKHAQRSQKIQHQKQEKSMLVDVFEVLPARWKGLLVGVAIGLVPLLAGQIFLQGEWKILGWVGLLICAIVAYVVGAATQDEPPTK